MEVTSTAGSLTFNTNIFLPLATEFLADLMTPQKKMALSLSKTVPFANVEPTDLGLDNRAG